MKYLNTCRECSSALYLGKLTSADPVHRHLVLVYELTEPLVVAQ